MTLQELLKKSYREGDHKYNCPCFEVSSQTQLAIWKQRPPEGTYKGHITFSCFPDSKNLLFAEVKAINESARETLGSERIILCGLPE